MKTALVINKGNSDNLGDQAINYVITEMLKLRGYKVDFIDYTFDDYNNKKFQIIAETELKKDQSFNIFLKLNRLLQNYSLYKYGLFRLSNFYKISSKLNKLKDNYDLIIVGGGQLIQSNSLFTHVFADWSDFLSKKYPNSKKLILGVGIGGDFTEHERKLYKKSLRQFDEVYLRDPQSIEICSRVFDINAEYIPDVVFNISSKSLKIPIKENIDNQNETIIIGITDFLVYKRYNMIDMDKEEYYRLWSDIVIESIEKNNGKVELFYTTARDLSETYSFRDYLKSTYGIELEISEISSLFDLINVIKQSSSIISGRMHALILGYAYNKNLRAYIISDKLKDFQINYINNSKELIKLQDNIDLIFGEITN